MKDRYHLSRQENVFLAKKRWPDSIYSGMQMENRNITFPQTQTILEGINVPGVSLDDIQAVLNMRDAWKFLLDNLDEELSIDFLCKLQERVAFREALVWGALRTGSIGISGVSYIPPVPQPSEVKRELARILKAKTSVTQRALAVFCWIVRSQLFWDGNKRTAILAANKILIEAGAGVLLVSDKVMLEFSTLLSLFYESGDSSDLQDFLYNKAIYGMDGATVGVVAEDATGRMAESTTKRVAEPTNKATSNSASPRTAEWLKEQRRARGMTQRELAAAIDIATNSVANIEQGQRKGSSEVWLKIENELKTRGAIS